MCPDRQVQKDPSLALKIFLALRFVEHRSQLALPSSLLSALSGRISTVPWETVVQFCPSSNVFRVSSSAHHGSSRPRENPAAVGVSQLRALAAAASDRFRRGVNSVSSARSHSASHNHILLGGPVSSSVNAAEGEGRPPRTQCLREDDQGDFLT